MKRSLIFVSILCLVSFSVNAQRYGFYGRGANSSYHKGNNSVYIGYHPDGVGHSRQAPFRSTTSRRSGSSIPLYKAAANSGFAAKPIEAGSYTHVNVRTTPRRKTSNNPASKVSHFDLGLSTEVSNNSFSSSSYSGGGGFSGGSSVVYGRTSVSSGDGSSNSFSSSLPTMATTTLTQNGDGDNTQQGFMEPPKVFSTPLGDAVLPLLLLLSVLIIKKSIT